MNFPRVAAAAVSAWIVSLVLGYVVNDLLLKDVYLANAGALRAEAAVNANLPLGFTFMLVGFFVFAYAYAKGYEGTSGVIEGLRYGVLIGVMLDCFAIVWYYATVPINGTMAAAMLIDYPIEFALYGVIVGSIYKRAEKTARQAAHV
jgi:hypothetical protein